MQTQPSLWMMRFDRRQHRSSFVHFYIDSQFIKLPDTVANTTHKVKANQTKSKTGYVPRDIFIVTIANKSGKWLFPSARQSEKAVTAYSKSKPATACWFCEAVKGSYE